MAIFEVKRAVFGESRLFLKIQKFDTVKDITVILNIFS